MNAVSTATPSRAASGRPPALLALTLAMAATLGLAGCSSLDGMLGGDKIDYKSQASNKTNTLEVPPDLTQLAREGRYQPQSGVVTASGLRQPGAVVAATATVAPTAVGEFKVMREGNTRWLSTTLSPDQVFPQLRSFWQESGFVLVVDNAATGVLETDWAENRAKLPQDILRRTLGRVFDSLYSTSERDSFRTRVERLPSGGSEIYISHRGMQEVYDNKVDQSTVWQPRPADANLEAEFLSRLMVRLGSKEADAKTAVAAATGTAAGASVAASKGRSGPLPATASMAFEEGFERAWRRVGVALDRSGFTVEDRDRSAGLYFVRYVDARQLGKEEPNFFSKLFKGDKEARPQRYRVVVKAVGTKTQVTVQNSNGEPDNSEPARQIIGRLIDELR